MAYSISISFVTITSNNDFRYHATRYNGTHILDFTLPLNNFEWFSSFIHRRNSEFDGEQFIDRWIFKCHTVCLAITPAAPNSGWSLTTIAHWFGSDRAQFRRQRTHLIVSRSIAQFFLRRWTLWRKMKLCPVRNAQQHHKRLRSQCSLCNAHIGRAHSTSIWFGIALYGRSLKKEGKKYDRNLLSALAVDGLVSMSGTKRTNGTRSKTRIVLLAWNSRP